MTGSVPGPERHRVTTAGPPVPGRRPAVVAGAVVVFFLGVVALAAVFKDSYVDDAYIQLQYVETLVEHHTWGLWPGRLSNTATSPLNVVVTALFSVPFSSASDAVVWITCFELTVMFVLLLEVSKRLFASRFFGGACFVALVTNPLLLSTIGLEGTLFVLLAIASIWFFVSENQPALAASLAALTLARPDGFLLFVAFLVFLPVRRTARDRFGLLQRGAFALVYAAVQAPWYVFSWTVLGSAVPDTLLIKVGQRWPQGNTFVDGLALYWRTFPFATFVTFAFLPLGLLLIGERRRQVKAVAAIVGAYGLLHYLAYSAAKVPPYHWYYLHQMLAAVVVGSLGVASLAGRLSAANPRLARLASAAVLVLPVLGLLHMVATNGVPFREPPMHSNWATPSRYRQVGLWLRDHLPPSSVVQMDGEIGTLAFYSKRNLVNDFSDMGIATQLMASRARQAEASSPLVGRLLRFNMRHRPQAGPAPRRTHVLRHVPFGPDERPPGRVVMSWVTSTAWAPRGRLYLLEVP